MEAPSSGATGQNNQPSQGVSYSQKVAVKITR